MNKRAVKLAPPEICALHREYCLLAQTPEEKAHKENIARQLEAWCLKQKTQCFYTEYFAVYLQYGQSPDGYRVPRFHARTNKQPRLRSLDRKPVPADPTPVAGLIDEAARFVDKYGIVDKGHQTSLHLLDYAARINRRILRSERYEAIVSQCLQEDGSTDPMVVLYKR